MNNCLLQIAPWLMLLLSGCTSTAFADSLPTASLFGLDTMAPESSWAVRLEQRSNDWHAQYDNNGRLVDVDKAFDQLNLNSNIFSALGFLGTDASLGTTQFDTRASTQTSVLTIGYGITPDITFGAIVPYTSTKNQVDFSVSGGNVGFNPTFDSTQAIGAANFPFAPVGAGVSALNAAGVQQILTNAAFGYQYKALKNSHQEGLNDPTLGLLWRAYKTPKESLILGVGVRLGVAKKDDPDDLLDIPLGDGSDDIRTRTEYFRDLGANFD